MSEKTLVAPVSQPRVILMSFGLKTAGNASGKSYILPKAHFYVDCRGIPDGASGHKVREWLADRYPDEGINILRPMFPHFQMTLDAIRLIPSRRKEREDPYKDPIVVCCLCAHGVNRSAEMKKLLSETLPIGWVVEVI